MTPGEPLETERLTLVPATTALLRAELAGRDALAHALHARVPEDWPPELYDEAALRWSLDWLIAHPEGAGWSFYYLLLAGTGPAAIGLAGFKGLPDDDGTVEIGYSILAAHRRHGYASEAVRALIAFAFADPRVRRVIAETLPALGPSIGVLAKCGFTLVGEGSAPGILRYVLERTAPAASA